MKPLLLFSLALAGCSQRNPDICSTEFPDRVAYAPPQSAEQVKSNVKGCVAHWAARLSMVTGPHRVVRVDC